MSDEQKDFWYIMAAVLLALVWLCGWIVALHFIVKFW
jgi:hypothetical protein